MPFRDPGRRREYGREWMKRNPDKAREAMRRWRRVNRETDLERKRAQYAADPQKAIVRVARYQKEHPESVVAARNRRRARELRSAAGFTPAQWRSLVLRYGGRCAYCGAAGRVGPDHRIPFARGGTNEIANILPACRRCNQRKYTSTEREFRIRLLNERLRSPDFVVVDWWRATEIQWVS